jgi:hypothetical protein
MDTTPHTAPEHESPEDEGIPDIGRPHPAKRATGDPQEGLILPGESARAAESSGVTAEEQREGEPLEQRLAQELPDTEPGRRREAGRLVDDSAVLDEEKDLVADAAEDEVEGRSAEEAAVRIEDAPEGLTDGPDSYLENDPAP